MRNLIFDLDGCLIDSSDVQKAALFGAYQEVVGDDKCPSYEEYIKYTGDSVDNVIIKLNLPIKMAYSFRKISASLVNKNRINWEAVDLIKEFKGLGCKIAICTGKDRGRTLDILEHYEIVNIFDVLVCADDVKHAKPSAEPILKTLDALNCSKDEAIFIGDGYNDILSAQAANVKSVLTLWYGDSGVPRISDYLANNVAELREILYGIT